MNNVRLSLRDKVLRVEDYPGAVHLIELRGRPAERCADLSFHRVDLEFANACLRLVEAVAERERFTVPTEAAWRSAHMHYCKCFAPPQGGNGRSHLSANRLFGKEDSPRMKAHRYLMTLRNEHLVHDDGTHNYSGVGAAIGAPDAPRNVIKIVVAAMDAVTIDDENVTRLRDLLDVAYAWVRAEYERTSTELADLVERGHRRAELLSKRTLQVAYPKR